MKILRKIWDWLFPSVVTPSPAAPVKPRTVVWRPNATKKKKRKICLMMNKRQFSEKEAKEEAATFNKKMHIRAYKCEYCEFWHLTKKKLKNG